MIGMIFKMVKFIRIKFTNNKNIVEEDNNKGLYEDVKNEENNEISDNIYLSELYYTDYESD